ncbi:MAG: RDD family protein [Planktomarina sp.]
MDTQTHFGTALSGLPDPDRQSGFYASVTMKRLFAWIIDGIIIFMMTLLISVLTFGLGFFIFFGIWAVLSFLYRVGTISSSSATIGMQIMSIEFRKGDGSRFDSLTALLHTAGTFICMATGVQIISILLMVFTSRKQGLPDLVLGTAALNRAASF